MSENVSLEPEEFSQEEVDGEIIEVETPQKRGLLSRIGCGVLLIIWFTLLLTPCVFFYLASNGEIRIWHSDIPEPHTHPRFLIELITEVDYRGLRFVNTSVVDPVLDDNALCVQTNVSYFLWETAEDNQDTSYCDCYARETDDSEWIWNQTVPEVCQDESS